MGLELAVITIVQFDRPPLEAIFTPDATRLPILPWWTTSRSDRDGGQNAKSPAEAGLFFVRL